MSMKYAKTYSLNFICLLLDHYRGNGPYVYSLGDLNSSLNETSTLQYIRLYLWVDANVMTRWCDLRASVSGMISNQ